MNELLLGGGVLWTVAELDLKATDERLEGGPILKAFLEHLQGQLHALGIVRRVELP